MKKIKLNEEKSERASYEDRNRDSKERWGDRHWFKETAQEKNCKNTLKLEFIRII